MADIVIATLLAVFLVTYSAVLDRYCHSLKAHTLIVATFTLVVVKPVETHVHCFVLRWHVGLLGLLGLTSALLLLHVHHWHLVRVGLVDYLDLFFPKILLIA